MVRPPTQKVQKSKKAKQPAVKAAATLSSRAKTQGVMAAYGNYVTDGNCLTCVGSSGVPKRLGFSGVRYVGSQYLGDVTTAAATSQLFGGNSGADLVSVNLMALSPDTINGRLAAIANLYRLYQWKHIRIEYESASSTATAGALALGIIAASAGRADGSGVEPTDFGSVQDCSPSAVGPYYSNLRLDLTVNEEEPLMSTDATTVMASPNINSYYLSGWPNVGSSGATTRGYIRMTYVIDFYSPCPTQGISFVAKLFNQLTVDERREMLARMADEEHSTQSNRRGWDVVSTASSRK